MPRTGPFTLIPHLAERVWGGGRFGPGIGEAWDLSVHPNGPSLVADGPHRGRSLAEVVVDHDRDFGGPVDLLAKRLDCAENLSVQVHPATGDAKTEAWVVLGAEPGAGVHLGFRGEPSAEQVRAAAIDGTLPDLLHFTELVEGDVVFVPAGTVHAIGAGLTLFELQQSSDTTHRLFDWGRTDRELHLDAALAYATLGPPPARPVATEVGPSATRLVECPFFHIDRLEVTESIRIHPGPRWTAIHGVSGRAQVGAVEVTAGKTAVVPSSAGPVVLQPSPAFVGLRYGPSDTT